jgi:hypothetical protein
MKVSTLKELVAAIPDEFNDKKVYVSRDEEGNGFKPLAYVAESLIKDFGYDLEFFEENYHSEEERENFELAVVLWP